MVLLWTVLPMVALDASKRISYAVSKWEFGGPGHFKESLTHPPTGRAPGEKAIGCARQRLEGTVLAL